MHSNSSNGISVIPFRCIPVVTFEYAVNYVVHYSFDISPISSELAQLHFCTVYELPTGISFKKIH